jgi:hypothetical protein
LDASDYDYAQENVPKIRVLGQSAFWDPQLEEGGIDGSEEETEGDESADDREDEELSDFDDDDEVSV